MERGENSATVRLLSESPVYKAHFPGFPITPGVTLLQMALELMGGSSLSGAREIKFMVPVLPGDGACIRFDWAFKDEHSVAVSIFLPDGTQAAKMSLSV